MPGSTHKTPLVLDFDGSLAELGEAQVVPLADWQEAVRFGCGRSIWRAMQRKLESCLPTTHGTVLTGSGDFHHLSHLLIQRAARAGPMDVVVCDNHPDNMRFPWGIHCGSWVRHATRLPMVGTIHVIGITSGDVGWQHAWENHLAPLYRSKLHYWTIGVDTRWSAALGLSRVVSSFASPNALLREFTAYMRGRDTPVYLSIDKDVLSADIARTNWDQGCFASEHLHALIDALAGRIVASDITGEVSIHRYRTRWKRWLAALDRQPDIPPAELARWQQRQVAINRDLLEQLARSQQSR